MNMPIQQRAAILLKRMQFALTSKDIEQDHWPLEQMAVDYYNEVDRAVERFVSQYRRLKQQYASLITKAKQAINQTEDPAERGLLEASILQMKDEEREVERKIKTFDKVRS